MLNALLSVFHFAVIIYYKNMSVLLWWHSVGLCQLAPMLGFVVVLSQSHTLQLGNDYDLLLTLAYRLLQSIIVSFYFVFVHNTWAFNYFYAKVYCNCCWFSDVVEFLYICFVNATTSAWSDFYKSVSRHLH